MLKAIKLRLYLNKEQEVYVKNLFGACRFVYNTCLAYKINQYQNHGISIGMSQTSKYLSNLKNNIDYQWLRNSHSKVLQQNLIDLDRAYKSFFNNGRGFPKFKSKKSKQSCRFPIDAIMGINGNRINIIRSLKDIHFKCSRQDEIILNKYQDKIKSGTLSLTKSGYYYFSILIDIDINKTFKNTDKIIGLDLGIKDFIVDSNGNYIENLKLIRSNEQKLKKLHRKLSKKKNGSKNKEKARLKLAKFHEKLSHKKENYLHHIINKLLNENQTIVIEDLNVSNMMKNKYLAKSIQELSLFRFKTILEYKAKWYNKTVIQVDKYYPSSKLCNCCGYKNNDLKLSDRQWVCPKCKTHLIRDLNAALNILNEGIRLLSIN